MRVPHSILLFGFPFILCSCSSGDLLPERLVQGKNATGSNLSAGNAPPSPASNKDALLRIPTGTLTGVQEGYFMLNKKGERVQIHGNFISIPPTKHTFNLSPEGSIVLLEAEDANAHTYQYTATYENADFSSDGQIRFDVRCESRTQTKNPTFRFIEQGAGVFKVEHIGDDSPPFTVRTNTSEAISDGSLTPSFDNKYKGKSSILPGKTKVNIRVSPPDGEILRTVDGGVSFTIDEVLELAKPVHLTRERATLVRVDGEKPLLKEANHQLELIKDGGEIYIAIVMDDMGVPTEVIVPKNNVRSERNSWFRSEELGGWVFSGLCSESSY